MGKSLPWCSRAHRKPIVGAEAGGRLVGLEWLPAKRTTAYRLLALLVDLMIQDTRIHIEILEFIRASA